MAVVRTDLRNTRGQARELRFEPTGVLTATDVQKAIEQVATTPPVIPTTSVNAAASPYTVLSTDYILLVVSSAGPVTINLQAGSARNGVPLIIKDVGGQAATYNITITPNGAETVDTLAPLLIDSNYGAYELLPRATGYTIKP